MLTSLEPVLERLDAEIESVGRLGYGTEDGTFGFEGHEQECDNIRDTIKHATQWGDIAIKLLAPPAGGRFYMHTWQRGGNAHLSLELQHSNLYFKSEDWPIVGWVRALLPAVSAALGAAASAYDPYRPVLAGPA
ncbi:hypothetical protein [Enhygromyxa salina]|uniref:hypothetical protein n=1 Tax=Enhygromyxa salina TaxID=215803 RepID=UPI0011B21235|nr:hypothetical protein [Enhygromyxa salina]